MLNKKLIAANAFLKIFALSKIPILFALRPKVVAWDEQHFEVVIPLRRFAKNHLGSMYFAALAAGADLAVGFPAMAVIQRKQEKISLVFKAVNATFLKRAESHVHFVCRDVRAIEELVEKAASSSERVEGQFQATAYTSKKTGIKEIDEKPVAEFMMTLSLKKK